MPDSTNIDEVLETEDLAVVNEWLRSGCWLLLATKPNHHTESNAPFVYALGRKVND